MLKNEKSANRIEHQNRKTDVFWHKNRKTDQKISKTAKPKIPMPPSVSVTEKTARLENVMGQFAGGPAFTWLEKRYYFTTLELICLLLFPQQQTFKNFQPRKVSKISWNWWCIKFITKEEMPCAMRTTCSWNFSEHKLLSGMREPLIKY